MAAFSLNVHKKKGLLKTDGVWWIVVPALLTSVAGGFVATVLSAGILRKLFGAFLVFLAVKGIFAIKVTPKKG